MMRKSSRTSALVHITIYVGTIIVVHSFTGPRHGLLATFWGFREWPYQLADAAIYLVAIVGTTAFLARILTHVTLTDLGLSVRGIRTMLGGIGLGLFLMSLIFVVSLLVGWIRIEQIGGTDGSLAGSLTALSAALALQIAIAINEELIFRGYVLQRLTSACGFRAAAVVSSILFALVHVTNPNASIFSALAIAVPGLLLAAQWQATRSLWMPIGFHLAWNVSEGIIFGFPLSGVTGPSIVKTVNQGPDVLLGGLFGPEGGLLGIAASLVGFAVLWLGLRSRSRAGAGALPIQKGGAQQI